MDDNDDYLEVDEDNLSELKEKARCLYRWKLSKLDLSA